MFANGCPNRHSYSDGTSCQLEEGEIDTHLFLGGGATSICDFVICLSVCPEKKQNHPIRKIMNFSDFQVVESPLYVTLSSVCLSVKKVQFCSSVEKVSFFVHVCPWNFVRRKINVVMEGKGLCSSVEKSCFFTDMEVQLHHLLCICAIF